MKCKTRCAGFTLVELLIALSIFAILSVMAYSGLNSVLDTRRQVEAEAARLAALQGAFARIEQDLEQAVSREIRDEYGDAQRALRSPVGNDGAQLELTRSGWRNPMQRPRAHLQRVAYGLKGKRLVRFHWYVLDRAQDSRPVETVLLEDVDRFELRFLDADRQWHAQWPVEQPAGQESQVKAALPSGVEVGLEIKGWGRVVRLLRLPETSVPSLSGEGQG